MTTNITTVKRKAIEVGGAVEVDTKNNSVKVWLQHGFRWKCNGQRSLEINFAPYHSKRLVIGLYDRLIEQMSQGQIFDKIN